MTGRAHTAVFPLPPETSSARVLDKFSHVFDRILCDLEQFIGCERATVFVEEGETLRVVSLRNHPQRMIGFTVPRHKAQIYQQIRRLQRPVILHDLQADPRFDPWMGDRVVHGWMGIPLIVEGNVVGMIAVESQRTGAFGEREAQLASSLVEQIAVAVEKAQMAEVLAIEKRNWELLYQLSQSLTKVLDPTEVAEKALQLVTEALGGCRGEIYLLPDPREDRLTLLAAQGYTAVAVGALRDQPYMQRGCGILGNVIQDATAVIAPVVRQDPRWIETDNATKHIASAACVPLVARGEMMGALALSSKQEHFFRPDDQPMLQALAAPIALALQNARLFAAEQQRRREAETLRNATTALVLDLDLEQVLQDLLARLQQVIPFDSACFLLLQPKGLCAVAGRGFPDPEQVIGACFPADNAIMRRLQREQRTIYYEDVRQVPEFRGWGGTHYVRGWMGVPLVHRGALLGYLTLDSRQVGAYGEAEATLAQAFANQATITIVNAQLLQESQQSVSEQRTVSQILRQLNATTTVREILPAVASGVRQITNCDEIELGLFEDTQERVRSLRCRWDTDSTASPHAEPTFVEEFAPFAESPIVPSDCHSRQIHQSPDLCAEAPSPFVQNYLQQGYAARICAPLRLKQRSLGYLQILWRNAQDYERDRLAVFTQIADAVAMTVEKNTLLVQTQQRMHKMEIISNLTLALRPLETRQEILQVALDYVMKTFQGIQGYISIPLDDPAYLDIVCEAGPVKTHRRVRNRPDDSLTGYVFSVGQPYLSTNVFADPLVNQDWQPHWQQAGYETLSAILAPLHTGEEVIGVIAVSAPTMERMYTQEDLQLLTALAGIVGTALHRSHVLETLEQRVAERTQELANANERLRELDQLKSEFVANVSHELRTPLTNIRLYLNLLSKGRHEKRTRYLEILQKETERLSTLIESILDLSRLNAARTNAVFTPVPVDIVQTTSEVIATHQPLAEAKGVKLTWDLPATPLTVVGDRGRLVQAITNLLANAINYTESGGTVTVTMRHRDEEVELTVQDTGIGLQADELTHLFDRFYRGQRASGLGIPGTGLGLSIVKEIVDLHQGRIAADGEEGIGSTFTVWLPTAS